MACEYIFYYQNHFRAIVDNYYNFILNKKFKKWFKYEKIKLHPSSVNQNRQYNNKIDYDILKFMRTKYFCFGLAEVIVIHITH